MAAQLALECRMIRECCRHQMGGFAAARSSARGSLFVAFHSPIRLAYKRFLLCPKAMGGPSRGGADPGSPRTRNLLGFPESPPAPNAPKCLQNDLALLVVKTMPYLLFVVFGCPGIALALLVVKHIALAVLFGKTCFLNVKSAS